MAEEVQTGGVMKFDYSNAEEGELDEQDKYEIAAAYEAAGERKKREKRNKWIIIIVVILIVLMGIGLFLI